jgi:hypothetical protein
MLSDATWQSMQKRLGRSSFRVKFRLSEKELVYARDRGLEVLETHARDFITRRVAPREPANDGKQTPMTGHPVFVAQHATATCCRGCLAKWHKIPEGKKLTNAQINYVTDVLLRWLGDQLAASKSK